MKTCFSEGKLMKQFGNPPLSKRTPLSTNPLFLSNFFMTPLFVEMSKTITPPNFRGEETMITLFFLLCFFFSTSILSRTLNLGMEKVVTN